MAQHFLLSAKARTLSLKAIYQAGEEKAYETFKAIRWADTNGDPVCPRCGCLEHYAIPTRRKFKCAGCYHQFSVTSGTIFASRKMSFTDLLAAICIFTNAVKGISACQLSRDLDCQYKTAFVLAHKLREALAKEIDGETLDGEVEIDGAYFGGHIRPANLKEDRVDRRLSQHQTGTRRVVVALRQRKGRTLPFVCFTEGEGVEIAGAAGLGFLALGLLLSGVIGGRQDVRVRHDAAGARIVVAAIPADADGAELRGRHPSVPA